MSNQNPVILTTQTDRPLIPINQPCERYLLLTLQVPTPSRPVDRLPLNLSLIIDRSGSMSGQKLEYVKEAAIHALRLLTDVDRTSLIIYDDTVETLAPSQGLTTEVRNDLIRRIRQVRPGGMTNLSGGWFTGCDQIANYMSNAYLNRALLLTDGLANRGMTDHEQLVYQAKALRQRGISSTTFGVGADFNQFLLQGIADAGGGHFYFIDAPRQIPNYFQGELGEMLQTVAREMTMEIEVPSGVSLTILNDMPVETSGNRQRLFLGDAYAGERRILVAKLSLPPHAGADLRLPLSLRYEDVQQRRPVQVEGETLCFTAVETRTCESQPVNEQVLSEAGRLETEKAKMEALRSEYSGDVSGARSRLRSARRALRTAMPLGMVAKFTDDLAEVEEEMVAGMTAVKRKARHYETYQAQRTRKDYKK